MKRNKFFSLLFVVVLAAQCFPVSVFAQTDVTDTVVVEAVTQDQSAEVGDVTVENGDGVDVSAENGYDAGVTTEEIQASETGIDASASGDGSSVTVETGEVTAGDNGIEASAGNGGSVEITTENVQSGDNGVTAEANGENSTVEVSTGTIDSGGTAIEAESSNGGSVEIKTEDIQSDGTGVTASGNGEGSSIDIKAGNITANGENEIISNSSSDGNEEFFVDKRSYGVNITNESGSAIEMTAGNVISGGFGISVDNRSDEKSAVNLNVGNITANGETILIPLPPEPWSNGQSSPFLILPSYGLDVTNVSSDYYSGERNGQGNVGTVQVKTGDISSESSGLGISNRDGGTVIIESGDITANAEPINEPYSWYVSGVFNGISIYNSDDSSNVKLTAGEIYSEGYGLNISNEDKGVVKVYTGAITANGESIGLGVLGQNGVRIRNSGNQLNIDGESIHTDAGTVELNAGDVVSQSGGIWISNDQNGIVSVSAGNITAKEYGVDLENSGEGGAIDFKSGKVTTDGNGIEVSNNKNNSTLNVETEAITAGENGIWVSSSGENSTAVVKTGDITANGEAAVTTETYSYGSSFQYVSSQIFGAQIVNDSGDSIEMTTGDITSGGNGVRVSNRYDEDSTVTIETGNITANGEAIVTTDTYFSGSSYQNVTQTYGADISNDRGGSIEMTAGDITSGGNGVRVSNQSDEKSTVSIEIGNIISNGETIVTTNTEYGSSYTKPYVSNGLEIDNSGFGQYTEDGYVYHAGTVEVAAGDITSESNGIKISNNDKGTVNVEAGNITANGETTVTTNTRSDGSTYSNTFPLYGTDIFNYYGGTVNFTAGDLVSAANGIYIFNHSGLNASSATINTGNITANGETTITVNTDSIGEVSHNVSPANGLMIVNDSSSTYNSNTQEWVQNDAGTVVVNTGNISSNHYGFGIRNYHNGVVSVTTGDITENGKAFSFEGNKISGQTPYVREYLPDKNTYQNEYRPVGFFINNYSGGHIDLSTGSIDSISNGIFIGNTDKDSSVNANTGDITANGEIISRSHSSGAYVRNQNGAETDLTTGNITSTGDGIRVYNQSGQDSSFVTVETGNITANGEAIITINTYADGTISSSGTQSYGAYIQNSSSSYQNSDGKWINGDAGTIELTTDDIISNGSGIYVSNSNNGTLKIDVNGDITSNGETIIIPETFAYIDAVGDVQTFNYNVKYTTYGVNIQSYDGGFSEMMTGDVDSSGIGIKAHSQGHGSCILLTVDGDINADDGIGLDSDSSMGFIEISVLGDVISSANTGINSLTYNTGSTDISVEGNVSSGNTTAVSLYASVGSEANLTIGGDVVTEAENGMGLSVDARNDSVVDVLVSGTIAGDQVGVSLGQTSSDEDGNRYGSTTTADNLKLTVWQIELNEEGHAAESMNIRIDRANGVIMDREAVYGDEEQAFEQSILYIIKLEQPVEGAVLRATDENGKALEKSHDYEVAHEGDTVLMKIDIQSGFELYGAYNGLGEKVPLLQDEEGNFYVEVPKGGGVYLSASLGRIHTGEGNYTPEEEDDDEENARKKMMKTAYYRQPAKNPIRQASGKPSAVFGTAAADAREFTISYDLNGGHFTDPSESASFKAYTGQKHVMLEAPVREGFRFLYWADASLTNSYPYSPGSWFTVGSSNMTFIAVWEMVK